jgi:hypothetical protein
MFSRIEEIRRSADRDRTEISVAILDLVEARVAKTRKAVLTLGEDGGEE